MDMNNTPEILEEIKTNLSTLCGTVGWEVSKAEDPVQLYDILFQTQTRGVACIVYNGEQIHQQVSRSAISKMKFGVAVSTRRDLTNPLAYKIDRGSGSTSLLQMVEKVKAAVLGMDISNDLSEKNPRLEGVAPVSMPDGTPLDAYQINFWAYVSNGPEPETEPTPEE